MKLANTLKKFKTSTKFKMKKIMKDTVAATSQEMCFITTFLSTAIILQHKRDPHHLLLF